MRTAPEFWLLTWRWGPKTERWLAATIYTAHEILSEIKRMKKGIMSWKSCWGVTRKWVFFTIVDNIEHDLKEKQRTLFQKTGEASHKLRTQLHRMVVPLLPKPPGNGGGRLTTTPPLFPKPIISVLPHLPSQKAKEKLNNLWDASQHIVHSGKPGKCEMAYQLITCPETGRQKKSQCYMEF